MWQVGLPCFRSAKSIDHNLPKREMLSYCTCANWLLSRRGTMFWGVRQNTRSHSNYASHRQERRSQRITSSAIESIATVHAFGPDYVNFAVNSLSPLTSVSRM